jgi:hypothetical protein
VEGDAASGVGAPATVVEIEENGNDIISRWDGSHAAIASRNFNDVSVLPFFEITANWEIPSEKLGVSPERHHET